MKKLIYISRILNFQKLHLYKSDFEFSKNTFKYVTVEFRKNEKVDFYKSLLNFQKVHFYKSDFEYSKSAFL